MVSLGLLFGNGYGQNSQHQSKTLFCSIDHGVRISERLVKYQDTNATAAVKMFPTYVKAVPDGTG
jgi:hypothetical protein